MKFITDEDLGVRVPKFLKSLGFDVIAAAQMARGKPDIDILEIANDQNRILITLDKDFGELVFKEKLIHSGVLFLRLRDESVENKKRVLLQELKSHKDHQGNFIVIREMADGRLVRKPHNLKLL